MHHPIRVLFLCTGNSARSQMAEALLRSFGGTDFDVYSAGTEPNELHPLAIDAMSDIGIDISHQRSKHLNEFLNMNFDYVITVCDRARDKCPTFPDDTVRIHWGFDDPASVGGSREDCRRVFQRVRNEIGERIRVWITVQRKLLREEGYALQAGA